MNELQLLILENPASFIEKLEGALEVSHHEIVEETWEAKTTTIDDIEVRFEMAHREGGGEGEGEHVDRVLKFEIGEQVTFLRTTGFYESYNGTEWSGEWAAVYPREVMGVQYFPTP